MHITILTVGSRGDVQPYLALGLGLKDAGHQVCFATEENYRDWVVSEGLEFARLPGDSKARHAQEDWLSMLEATRDRPIISMYRCNTEFVVPQLQTQLEATWQVCQGTEVIIAMPSVFGAPHVAEKLGIPYYSVWTCPFTPTREFPHSWSQRPNQRWFGGSLNHLSYWVTGVIYAFTLMQPINQWRQETLGLPPIGGKNGVELKPAPTLYLFSPSVLPKPSDWDENINITGYWFLEQSVEFSPPKNLVNFLESGSQPVYIGFGSIADRDPKKTIKIAIDAVVESGQRAVLEAGWAKLEELELPPQIFKLEGHVPHTWLFPRMAALIHHGGSGTTGQGLRNGKPTVVVYQRFTDYYFWGQRIAELGVGPKPIQLEKLTVKQLKRAISTMVTDPEMQVRAANLGQKIRSEDGVARAIEVFEQYLPQPVKVQPKTVA